MILGNVANKGMQHTWRMLAHKVAWYGYNVQERTQALTAAYTQAKLEKLAAKGKEKRI